MEKDQSIIDLIERLRGTMDKYHLSLIDFWQGDLCAIGLRNGLKMMYISTWPYVNGPELKYNIDMELLDEACLQNLNVVGKAEGISEPELIREIDAFFGGGASSPYPGFAS